MKATWMKAVRAENYATWPGLTTDAVQKHFPEAEETLKGHSRKIKVGIQLTKVNVNGNKSPGEDDDNNSTKAKRKEIFIKLVDLKDALHNKIFSDHTGAFPYRSSQGMRYVMVVLECDTNYIMVEGMQDRMVGEMI